MWYEITNNFRATQIIYDGLGSRIRHHIEPGTTVCIELSSAIAAQLRSQKFGVREAVQQQPSAYVPMSAGGAKTPLIVIGMWGIGDNLHQRAVLRELMKRHDVWLETCHAELYHDLVADGLKLDFRSTTLHAQARTIERERGLFKFPPPPPGTQKIKLWYHKAEIDKCGSIAEAMFDPFGMRNSAPDFSLPVKQEWAEAAQKLIDGWAPTKPLMIFRPIVQRREWDGAARNPDPAAYRAIFEAIRDRYFVVSIADLAPGREWIVGAELGADIKLHGGELDFPTLAGLWRKADLVFGNAGFGPVLAQAVGTPVLIVYGGRESYRTTERAGAHLAPTLGIDPITPCDCHSHHHKCDKAIDIPAAVERAVKFCDSLDANAQGQYRMPRAAPVLLNFGCGTNHLPGWWRNMDIEVNIEQPLPFESASADAVFSEHCVEHTSQYKAVAFFKEAFRVLKPGGLIRITVPCLPQIIENSEEDYWRFASKWTKIGPTLEGAMDAIVNAHGHQTIWGADTLRACLFYAGFRDLKRQKPGVSGHDLLRGIEGHGTVIGAKFNEIESLTFEGIKPGKNIPGYIPKPPYDSKVSVTGPVISSRITEERQNTLIFATTYVDSPERQELTQQWLELHTALNPDCDFLLVDSASPLPLTAQPWAGPPKVEVFNFGDNIGHLSRRGKDGWGRAFCKGLALAVERGYEHVVHVEGDSLCRIPASRMIELMRAAGKPVGSIPVIGTTRPVSGWVETGLMVFDVAYLASSGLIKKYDWPHRQERPTPEIIVARLLGESLAMLPLKGRRNDDDVLTRHNIVDAGLDWVTHCHRDVWAYGEFLRHALQATGKAADKDKPAGAAKPPFKVAVVVGGAATVWDEVEATRALIGAGANFSETPPEVAWLVINSAIPLFSDHCSAISLHPAKLKDWLAEREANGHPAPGQVWAHVKHMAYPSVTHIRDDWRGSSGLFAVAVARQLGFDRIILCGVPMTVNGGHIQRGKAPWSAREQFIKAWGLHREEIRPFVRSWSGWTAETFGSPDVMFLRGEK